MEEKSQVCFERGNIHTDRIYMQEGRTYTPLNKQSAARRKREIFNKDFLQEIRFFFKN